MYGGHRDVAMDKSTNGRQRLKYHTYDTIDLSILITKQKTSNGTKGAWEQPV
jgi:hypothetical protein